MTDFKLLHGISIHALREEGDSAATGAVGCWVNFYPRPPRGGRLRILFRKLSFQNISIHALREEGDPCSRHQAGTAGHISIHALREEGDARS